MNRGKLVGLAMIVLWFAVVFTVLLMALQEEAL